MDEALVNALSGEPKYFPVEDGLYHVRAGLRALGREPSENVPENLVFQLDSQFARYRENKEACRAENISKYYLRDDDSIEVENEVALWMIERLAREHPRCFTLTRSSDSSELQCGITKECLVFASDGSLESPSIYTSLFDAVCSQVQEDAAIVRLEEDRDWVAALHLCAPNHWAAGEKIGRSFKEVHEPVAEIESVLATAPQLLKGMVFKSPYVRFAWGISSDTLLNHHPELPPGRAPGRKFSSDGSGLFLRIERQTMHGFPKSKASFFTIRTYFRNCETLSSEELGKVISAIDSMTVKSRCYKGLSEEFDLVRESLSRRRLVKFPG